MNKRAGMTAADIVNTYDEERLANILYLYGELKNSRKLASVIVKARSGQNIRTIGEFWKSSNRFSVVNAKRKSWQRCSRHYELK